MTGFGLALIVLGALVVLVGPSLGEGGKTHAWYLYGGLSMAVGACMLIG